MNIQDILNRAEQGLDGWHDPLVTSETETQNVIDLQKNCYNTYVASNSGISDTTVQYHQRSYCTYNQRELDTCDRSPAVKEMLGKPYNALSNLLHELAYQSLVNHVFCSSGQEKRIKILKSLGIDYQDWSSDAGPFAAPNISSECNVSVLAARALNRCLNEAAYIVGCLMGMRPEFCFNTYPPKQGEEGADNGVVKHNVIPEQLIILRELYELELFYIYDMAGDVDQAICRYRAQNGTIIYMIASRSVIDKKTVLAVGCKPAINWPLGRYEIECNPGALVILCMNLTMALDMRKAAEEAHLQSNTGTIISGYLGDFESLQMACFRGHPLIIVPEFTSDGWKQVDKVASRMREAGATNIMIYPYPFKTVNMPKEYLAQSVHSPWKDRFIDGHMDLTRIEILSNAIHRVQASALLIPAFERLREEVGLVEIPKSADAHHSEGKFVVKKLSNLNAKSNLHSIDYEADPTLGIIIQPGFILFIWGGSNSGKTFVLFQLALGIASATSALSFACGGPPRKVLMIDGELTPAEFAARMTQLVGGNDVVLKALEENIVSLCVRDSEVGAIDILDSAFQNKLLELVEAVGISVVTFDPLGRLGLGSLQGKIAKLFDFFNRLEAVGVAIIFVAHATKEGSGHKGDGGLEDFSKTVIRCEGREALLKEDGSSDALQAALEHKGAMTTRITIDKCKVPYKINSATEVYHIPPGGPMCYLEGNMRDTFREPFVDSAVAHSAPSLQAAAAVPICEQDMGADDNFPVHDETVSDLSEDQQRLWELFVEGARLSRRDVETKLAWGEDKTGNELKFLKDMKLIKPGGSGRSITYTKA